MQMQRLTLLVLAILLVNFGLKAQNGDQPNYLEVGLKAGVVNYQGDLQRALFTTAGSNPLVGGFLRYSFGQKVALRAVAEFGRLAADDANNADLANRGFSFEAPLYAGELSVEVLPLGRERYSNGIYQSQWNPYLLLGLGIARADATVTTQLPNDPRFPEADDRSVFVTLPFGGGLRYDIASGFAVGAEANWRATFSDYLDGVSVNGRSDREDWFWTFGVYASFTFGRNEDSMNF